MRDTSASSDEDALVRQNETTAIIPVHQAAEYSYWKIARLLPQPRPKEEFFCFASSRNGKPIAIFRIGPAYDDDDGEGYTLAPNEARRLAEHRGCLQSSQICDGSSPERSKHGYCGGAVRHNQYIFSAAGSWDETGNEILAAAVVHLLFEEEVPHGDSLRMFGNMDKNPYASALRELLEVLEHDI